MPKYEITDNKTGRTVVVEGSKPPTSADADAIFQKAGLRQTTAPQKSPGLLEQGKNAIGDVTDFLFGRSKQFIKEEGEQTKNRTFGDKLKEAAVSSINPLAGLMIDFDQGKASFDKTGMGAAGEVASYMMPQNQLLKAGKAGTRIAGGTLQSAGIGALMGITDPEAEGIEDRLSGTVQNVALGAVTGGVTQTGFEGINKATSYLKNKGYSLVASRMKETNKSKNIIRRHGGPDKFAKKIVEYDIPKSKPKAIKYLDKLNDQYEQKVDDVLLDKGDEVINTRELITRARERVVKDYSLPQGVGLGDDAVLGANKNYLKQAMGFLDDLEETLPEEMTLYQSNELRKHLDKTFKGKLPHEINSGEKYANDILANEFRNQVKSKAPQSVKDFFQQYSLTKDVIETYYKEPRFGLAEVAGTMSFGIPGALTGNPWATLASVVGGYGATRTVRSPGFWRSTGAKMSQVPQSNMRVNSPTLAALQRLLNKQPL